MVFEKLGNAESFTIELDIMLFLLLGQQIEDFLDETASFFLLLFLRPSILLVSKHVLDLLFCLLLYFLLKTHFFLFKDSAFLCLNGVVMNIGILL